MNYYGKAQETAERILEAFRSGSVAKSIAPIFIRRKDDVPCRSWSWGNQLIYILNGTRDARGIRQWNSVGRSVKKGSRSFDILVPLFKEVKIKADQADSERTGMRLCGFKTAPVFPVESTEGDELPGPNPDVERWINSLPLLEVARSWGLKVDACNGRDHAARGSYTRGKEIALAVTNLSTWAHELIHAADDRLGNLTERGQHWRSETVAELGGAVLLEALGLEQDSDRGGCFEYVKGYAEAAGIEPVQACMEVLKRTCEAVNMLLIEAETLSIQQVAEIPTEVAQQ